MQYKYLVLDIENSYLSVNEIIREMSNESEFIPSSYLNRMTDEIYY